MSRIAGPLAIIACLSMAGAAGAAVPARHGSICYGGRDVPKEAPDRPAGCHATLGCAEHRKLKTIPW
jgi:hypothetical protein